jgi:hypothetical protein
MCLMRSKVCSYKPMKLLHIHFDRVYPNINVKKISNSLLTALDKVTSFESRSTNIRGKFSHGALPNITEAYAIETSSPLLNVVHCF